MKNFKLFIVINVFSWCLLACTSAPKTGLVAQYELAMVSYRDGRFSDAEPMLRKLLEKYPQFAEGWYRLGNLYVRTGQYEAALTAFNECLRYDSHYSKAWYNLSLTHLKMSINILDQGLEQVQIGSEEYNQLQQLKSAMLATATSLNK
jgi:tetratricopeptide (TPR) repeat protein